MERGEGILSLEGHTMAAKLKIQIISYLYVDDTQKTLISSLELALIEDLHGDDGRILDGAER
jgi:hypothetical protein